MLVAYVSGHAAGEGAGRRRAEAARGRPEALFSTLGRVAARGIETQVLAEKMDDWVDGAGRQHGRRRAAASTTTRSGSHRHWPADAAAPASTKRRAARSATGCTSRTARSRTISASCRAPGTPGRATPRAAAARTRRRCWHAGRRCRAADRDPADRALVRSVHGVRRPRRRRAAARDRRGEGRMSAGVAIPSAPTHPLATSWCASTCGRSRCASRTG